MRRLALVLALVSAVAPVAADAHRGAHGEGYLSTFAAVLPNVLGLSVNILGSDDRLRISNYSGQTVVILGYEHEPYLRFTKAGVFENVRSPAAYLNRFRYPPARAPGSFDAKAPPSWRRVRAGVTFEWHDHRIHWTSKEPPAAVRESPDTTRLLFRWRVPGRADGKPFALTGFLGYVPPAEASNGHSRSWVVPVAAAGLGVLAAAAVVGMGARRRKRRAP